VKWLGQLNEISMLPFMKPSLMEPTLLTK